MYFLKKYIMLVYALKSLKIGIHLKSENVPTN